MNRKLRKCTSPLSKHRRFAQGGPLVEDEPTADTKLRKGGRTQAENINPNTNHPQYGLFGWLSKILFAEGGSPKRLRRAMGGAGKTRKNYPYTD